MQQDAPIMLPGAPPGAPGFLPGSPGMLPGACGGTLGPDALEHQHGAQLPSRRTESVTGGHMECRLDRRLVHYHPGVPLIFPWNRKECTSRLFRIPFDTMGGGIPFGCQKRTCEEGSLFSSFGWPLDLKGSFLRIRSLLLRHLVAIFFELLRIEGACPRCNVVQDRLYRVAGVEPLWNLKEIEGLRGRILRTSKWSLEDNEENPF